jgi:hypothetical protein
LTGSVFPNIVWTDPTGAGWKGGSMPFNDFAIGLGPADSTEYAKAIVWAFIAGFAERLVPDTLDRIARLKQTRAKPA